MDQSVTQLLRDKGFKVTPQRLAIYDILMHSRSHPNAEMIFNELQPHYPTMSLATVYKTVDILNKIGLVQILNVGEDSFRYDADMSEHAHVRCMECGRVDDVHISPNNQLSDEVEEQSHYQLQGQQHYFFGVCPDCQRKHKN